MIILIGDNNPIELIIISNTSRSIELSSTSTITAELSQKLSTPVENLHSIIGSIRNDNIPNKITTDTPRPTKLSILTSLTTSVDNKQRLLPNSRQRAATLHLNRKRTALNVIVINQHRNRISAIQMREVVNEISAVLFVDDLYIVELLVRSLNEDSDGVATDTSRLIQVVFCLHYERGHFRFEAAASKPIPECNSISGERGAR